MKSGLDKNNKRAYFLIKDNILYVANDGRSVDRSGFYSLCRTNISSKSPKKKDRPYDHFSKIHDRDLVLEYSKLSVTSFLNDANLFTQERNNETGIEKDYSGRWPLELLQNIDIP